MSYYPEFARIVEEALTRQDRTPTWLAQRLGVNHGTVSRWLNHGTRPRDPETVARIADVLGITSQRQALLAAAGYGYQDSPSAPEFLQQGDSHPRHNLPAPVTSLVGRTRELNDIAELLAAPDCRLLTLWGIGGIGKTRLALAAAQAQIGSTAFPDGIYFVSLASYDRYEQIVSAIAAALDLPLYSSGRQPQTPEAQLLDFLRSKRLLMVLDNLEHLPEAGALIARVLEAGSGVKVLATSRERLRSPGEQLYLLTGLSYPNEDSSTDAGAYDAPRLFLERLRHTRPDFAPDVSEMDDLLHICRAVDGMPLALELAAVWGDTLTLDEIHRELEGSLSLLATDAAGGIDRHRSMEATFEASWQRLTEQEQRVFARLSVFRGGFTREAAERVAGATLPVLGALVIKSFVRFQRKEARYDIHELMRQYGADRLAEDAAAEERTSDRHSAYFCELLAWGFEEQKGPGQLDALTVLDTERGNWQVAWDFALAKRNLTQIEQAMEGLARFLNLTGDLNVGRNALSAVAEDESLASSPAGQRMILRALAKLTDFEFLLGRVEHSEQLFRKGQRLLRQLADMGEDVRYEHGMLLTNYGQWLVRHDVDEAIEGYARLVAMTEEMDLEWEAAVSLLWLGRAKQMAGQPDALEILNQAKEAFERLGDRIVLATALEFIASHQVNVATDYHGALETARASLALRRELRDQLAIASSLTQVGRILNLLQQPTQAEIALNEALAVALRFEDRDSECAICEQLMVTYRQLQRREKAQAMAERGLALATQFGDKTLADCFRRELARQENEPSTSST